MQKEIPSRKILLFDIDTILLRERLGSSYTNAYKKIEDYYCSNDFLHIQFADITSNWYNMSDIHETPEFDGTEINKTIDNFVKIDLSSHDDFDVEL